MAKTTYGFWPIPDDTEVSVNGFTLNTGTGRLTGEQMYAGGFSIAYIGGNFEAIGANFRTRAMKTQPVPEPLTIFSAAVCLGFGAFFKKEYSRK